MVKRTYNKDDFEDEI